MKLQPIPNPRVGLLQVLVEHIRSLLHLAFYFSMHIVILSGKLYFMFFLQGNATISEMSRERHERLSRDNFLLSFIFDSDRFSIGKLRHTIHFNL